MIKNYLKTAFRNLYRTKQFSFINILGLTIGITACLAVLIYIDFEKSYDRFYKNSNKIYRLRYERTSDNGESVKFASCCPPAGLRVRALYPEVEKVARIFRYMASVSYNENKFIEEKMFFAEPEFLEMFDFKLISGDITACIHNPNTAIVSETTAFKYFGNSNPIGKTIRVDKKTEYLITGVFENNKSNSHIKCDIILSFKNILGLYGNDFDESWGDTGVFTYLLFKENADINAFKEKLVKLIDKEFGEVLKKYKLSMELPLQPLTDIHLTSHYMQELEVNGNVDTVKLLNIIAILIIIIAWVNYINLSTARSLSRAKEVGLRKVVGASRYQLIYQFFIEVIIINSIAIIGSVLLINFIVPAFYQAIGTSVVFSIWNMTWFWVFIFTMFVVGVFISGFYPVLILTSFNPIKVLKGKLGNKPKGLSLRKVLVVFQFSMAILLISFTLTVFYQIAYMKNIDLGFEKEQILAIRAPRVRDANFKSTLNTFKQELLKKSEIEKFAVATEVPGRQILWDAGGIFPVGSDESKNYQIVGIDYDFVDLFKTKLIEGRNFSKEFPTDSVGLILNETAVKWMGFENPKKAIGQRVNYWDIIYTIIGVMKDYHQQSPKAQFEPTLFRLMPYGRDVRGIFAIKMKTHNVNQTLTQIKSQYLHFFNHNPFEYFFIDDYYNRQFKADELIGNVFAIFSTLAIAVTAMGLLGLFSYMVMQRRKEISIRNVLGAGTSRILFLFGKDLLVLLLISFIITLPIIYFSVITWLESFAKKMPVSVWLFLFPVIFVLFMAVLTIGLSVIKAARANPVDNLRYE